KRKIAVSLALGAGLILAGFFVWKSGLGAVDLARRSMEKRLDYWQATWAMIIDGKYPGHFWLGVGQGNFNRFYPRYMSPSAHEEVMDPHNFALEMWATSGIFAMLALLGVFGLFFWKTHQAWSGKMDALLDEKPDPGNTKDSENRFGTRWEFYLGGIGGLILGFILSKFDLFSDPNLTWNGFVLVLVGSCVRSLIWFAVFALIETVPWTSAVKRLVLTGGVAALLLNLTVSGGISFPSVAQPMWVVAGLALNSMTESKVSWHTRNWLGKVFPLPVLAAGCLMYLFLILIPVNECFRYLKAAQFNYSRWPMMDAKWRNSRKEGANIQELHRTTFENTNFVQNILRLLKKSHEHDPLNVVPGLDSALWEAELWKLKSDISLREHAIGLALSSMKLDPESSDPYFTLYQLNLLFAQFTETKKKEFWEQAANAIKGVVRRNPSNVRIRYQYAEILFLADDAVEGKIQARHTQHLDEMATEPLCKLSPQQREQIRKWLIDSSDSSG
ncbi:MAG TPA: O-antigen ligase family protein, partial [Gemmataceae bacterium]|nr:O-antigen ligase family protein [Gemmataceae bacterium]